MRALRLRGTRGVRRQDPVRTCEGLRLIREGLRSGMSLRQALCSAAGADGSPFAPLAGPLTAGRPLAPTLREASRAAGTREESASLLVLSVQAEAGGDPLPLLEGLEARLRRRAAAVREARALTVQARMSARALLLLTPGFLLLLALVDPGGTWAMLATGSSAGTVAAGIGLQIAGAAWIGAILRGVVPAEDEQPRAERPRARREPGRMHRVPVLRAAAVLVRGRRTRDEGASVAEVAEVTALLLRAGLAPLRALELVAPAARGSFGEAVRSAVACGRMGAGTVQALVDAVSPLPDPTTERFARAFAVSERLGVPLADTLDTLAEELREAEGVRMTEAVRRASVRVLLPLTLLILPAFVLACLVPLFLSGLGGLSL